MNPQYSFPVPADLRWRDDLQAKYCTDYLLLHVCAINENRLVHSSLCSIGFLSCRETPWLIGGRTDVSLSVHPLPSDPGTPPQDCFPGGCSSGALRQFTPIDKQQIFNRMNGSPGDPPDPHMHKFKSKRITPFIHRLVSDPTGMEAGWEALT